VNFSHIPKFEILGHDREGGSSRGGRSTRGAAKEGAVQVTARRCGSVGQGRHAGVQYGERSWARGPQRSARPVSFRPAQ
jgi:hypothetical protein